MRIAAVAILISSVALVRAELPSIRFDRLAPLGASAGSTVEVEIAGAEIDDVKALRFDHPGIKAEHVKDRKFKIRVAADVPAGTFDVRLLGKYGISNPRLLQVSHGLTEVAEKEPNDEVATAQPIAVNSVVNGTSDGNREDMFKFPLRQGQRVVIECQAQKLDSQLDATLTLFDASGKQLALNGDYFGRDPLIDFIAPKDGDYYVSVYDLSFRGGFPYRLLVTDLPHVENVFPRAVEAGKPVAATIYGRNLGKGAKPSILKINDLPLDEMQETVTAPSDLLANGLYRFSEHPTNHAVLPTAATCTLTGFQVRGVPVLVTDTAATLEVEPNDDPHAAQRLALPAVVSARFDRERDADWYEFETAEAGPYAFDVYCERIGGRADPYLVVLDDKDARVAEFDDFGARINAFDGHLRDPSGTVNLNSKKRVSRGLCKIEENIAAAEERLLSIRPDDSQTAAGFLCGGHSFPEPGTRRHEHSARRDGLSRHRDSQQGWLRRAAHDLSRGTSQGGACAADSHHRRYARDVCLLGRCRRGGLDREHSARRLRQTRRHSSQSRSPPPIRASGRRERTSVRVGRRARAGSVGWGSIAVRAPEI